LNELELSNDLTQITTEIKTYQSIGGQAIFEIGKRLKKVKDEDLAHGQYLNWLESINMNRRMASKFVKVVEELPNETTSSHIGVQALYEIATMPEEEREKPQQLESGETKKPDEMTIKELREVKRQLKARDETIERQSKMIDDLNEQEPQVVEKEIVPNDYEQLKTQNKQLEKELSSTRSELDLKKTQYSLMKESSAEAEELKSNIEQLKTREKNLDEKIKAMFEFNELMQEIGSFFDEKMASMRFKPLVNELSGTDAVHKLEDTVNMVDFWVTEMRKITPNQNTKIIEGEIVNE